jgi:hypothetical protein
LRATSNRVHFQKPKRTNIFYWAKNSPRSNIADAARCSIIEKQCGAFLSVWKGLKFGLFGRHTLMEGCYLPDSFFLFHFCDVATEVAIIHKNV